MNPVSTEPNQVSNASGQLPWTEEQWGLLRRAISEEAHRARVASRFLPLVGPVAPDEAIVLKQQLSTEKNTASYGAPERLVVDETQKLNLVRTSIDIYLKSVEVNDPSLTSAIMQCRRAANILSTLEDDIVFNGQAESYGTKPPIYTVSGGNVGMEGLLDGTTVTVEESTGESLIKAVVHGISRLEANGFLGPFACVLGNKLFEVAQNPTPDLVLPSTRFIPFLGGGPLLRSGTIPSIPKEPQTSFRGGVIVSLAGNPIDLVVGQDMGVSFLQVTLEPRWVLRVSQRFVLRQHEPGATVALEVLA